jgi:hypothetical protein
MPTHPSLARHALREKKGFKSKLFYSFFFLWEEFERGTWHSMQGNTATGGQMDRGARLVVGAPRHRAELGGQAVNSKGRCGRSIRNPVQWEQRVHLDLRNPAECEVSAKGNDAEAAASDSQPTISAAAIPHTSADRQNERTDAVYLLWMYA